MNTEKKHTFVICAYKESKYLEECIKSLENQTINTNIIMATSTPNKYINDLCEKYKIPLYINEGEHGITQDWNFAYNMTETDYVTIAHQDDIYDEKYVERLYRYISKVKKPLIFFTDYYEIRNGEICKTNKLLRIKRLLLFPLRFKCLWNRIFVRRRILSLGSSICCPSITFVKENLPNPIFVNHFRSNADWEAWENLSKLKGGFVFCNEPLTYHRIHEESETSATINETVRGNEDYEMFCKFWPKPIAKILTRVYGTSEKSNNL